MIVYKLNFSEGTGGWLASNNIDFIIEEAKSLLSEDPLEGVKVDITTVEMSEEEYASLLEHEGW